MPRLEPSVCIDAVFEGMPVAQAIAQVKEAGFDAFEFWGWWDRDLDGLLAARDRHQMNISACCTRFISLVDPSCQSDYLAGLEETVAVAQRIGVKTIISQVGDALPGMDRASQHDQLVHGLKAAASILENSGTTLVIEPLNDKIDHPGYFLVHSEEAFQIVDAVGSPDIQVVYDIYHQQISEGHLIATIQDNIDKIGHFHAAGNPGRHELTRGEIQYSEVFRAIAATDYDGYVGLEYWPVDEAAAGLREIRPWFS